MGILFIKIQCLTHLPSVMLQLQKGKNEGKNEGKKRIKRNDMIIWYLRYSSGHKYFMCNTKTQQTLHSQITTCISRDKSAQENNTQQIINRYTHRYWQLFQCNGDFSNTFPCLKVSLQWYLSVIRKNSFTNCYYMLC